MNFASIIKYGVVVALALGLVGGTAYILLRPPETRVAAQGRGGLGQNAGEAFQESNRRQGGRGYMDELGTPSRWGQGNGGGRGVGQVGLAPEVAGEWLTMTGEVVGLDYDLTLLTDEGEMMVHLAPEWYWEAQGTPLEAGDRVAVTGFYDGDTFEVSQIENLTTGQAVVLRDESGRPMWAGRGRRGQ